LLRPIAAVILTVSAVIALYFTRHEWMPHVFPSAQTEKPPSGESHEETEQKDRITLSEQAQQNLHLEVEQASPREYWRTILLPGAVVDRPGESDRGVTTRVAGVIVDIKARPGDTVRGGEPLFLLKLASEFVQTTQADLAKSAKELEFAITRRDLIAKQVKDMTTAGTALIDQENQVKRVSTQVQGYRRQLQLFGLTDEQINRAEAGDFATEMVIAAPSRNPAVSVSTGMPPTSLSDGLYELQELKVRLGDQVQAGQTLCTLADHQRLLVEGWAFKSEARALATAAEKRVPIRAEFTDEQPGEWPPIEPLIIHHLANQVDPVSRTFSFYMPIENQGQTFTRDGKTFFVWRFRPGQRVRLRIPVEKLVTLDARGKTEQLPFVLPAGAVVREGPESYVFVQSGDVFKRKPVHVLYEDRNDVVIANDGCITESDWIVRNEAAAINRALKAGAGGEVEPGHTLSH
jgi:multidrug efflux pump subunit AcrA (membrane-fusion protein)